MPPLGHLPREDGHRIAYHQLDGRGPMVVWLGGFHSDMQGAKALALQAWAQRTGRSFLRFDYFGHGASTGAFKDGVIGRWRDDSLAVADQLTTGPLVLVGSSMGAWLACLVALARPERIAGLVLIAPAIDFTEALIEPQLSAEARACLKRNGFGDGPPIMIRTVTRSPPGSSTKPARGRCCRVRFRSRRRPGSCRAAPIPTFLGATLCVWWRRLRPKT